MQLNDAILRVFADVFAVPRESINLDTSPETIETWDSLNHLNLVLALEQEFQVQFEPDEIETLVSPRVVCTLIGARTGVMEPK